IVEYEYDDLGRQIATIDHPVTIDGQVVQHRSETIYDEYGRVSISRTNVKQFADGTIDRSETQELKYIYDARGNVTKTIFADGTEISAVYNEQGQKISETNKGRIDKKYKKLFSKNVCKIICENLHHLRTISIKWSLRK
ncbi:MAG: hypothetical protein LBE12_10890, partial [Planctomycetaceae bacterium]|nr:hypothetical protein [Planctomycetaceae bacterium]